MEVLIGNVPVAMPGWDTFITTAICPACGKRWNVTQCPKLSSDGCGEVRPHEDWYVFLIALEFMVRIEESPEVKEISF